MTHYLSPEIENINVQDRKGNTLLHDAADDGSWIAVEELLQKGADPNIQNSSGNTPLHKALDTDVIILLLRAKTDLNIKNRFGNTPLHEAAIEGSENKMLLLLAANANPNIRNTIGNTPLHWASFYGNFKIVKELIRYTDFSIKNDYGHTAVDIAKNKKIEQFILEYRDLFNN